MGLITCTDYEGYFVLTVKIEGQTKYMRAFDASVNKEDTLDQVLNDIQVNHGK